ncbi:MAG: alanine--tRNA ligase, partial [Oscillospiraceae bacterium]
PDIENVGKTARHGTYFEMLGNFSFGDYFKKEAIAWAWEYFTKILEIPQELLYVSVYEEDDEAETIWLNDIGLNKDHVVRMGKADNFWEHGQGPCGPCTEIYFDRGAENGCGSSDCKVGCDCDRYVEVWNVVFSQFNNDGKGNYSLLKNKNIDTGMGLERLACVMQGVDNIFMVDTVKKILEHVTKISNKEYGKDSQNDISIRVITDHIRSTTFMVSDGVVPQNEGRGYVLRRLLRRAARHGKLLGINQPFLYKICNTVIEENKSAYPELEQKADYIKKVIKIEEERFEKTIGQGIELLTELIDKIDSKNLSGDKILNGADAFKLYDTFGFPIDLTKEIIAERNICLDEEKFISLMNEQKTRARASS